MLQGTGNHTPNTHSKGIAARVRKGVQACGLLSFEGIESTGKKSKHRWPEVSKVTSNLTWPQLANNILEEADFYTALSLCRSTREHATSGDSNGIRKYQEKGTALCEV